MSRYDDRLVVLNTSPEYKKLFDPRNVKFIRHHRPEANFTLPDSLLNTLLVQQEIWEQQTKLYKLASKYYGQVDLWWIIGLVNNKPTDIHWNLGDVVNIPLNPDVVLRFLVDNRNIGGAF